MICVIIIPHPGSLPAQSAHETSSVAPVNSNGHSLHQKRARVGITTFKSNAATNFCNQTVGLRSPTPQLPNYNI